MATLPKDLPSLEGLFVNCLQKRLEGRNSAELEVVDAVEEEFTQLYNATYPVATLRGSLADLERSLDNARENRLHLHRERTRVMLEEIESMQRQLAAEKEVLDRLTRRRNELLERWSAAAHRRVLQNALQEQAAAVEDARQALIQCRRECTFDEIRSYGENFLQKRTRQRMIEDMIGRSEDFLTRNHA